MPDSRHHLRPFLHDLWSPLSHVIGSGAEAVRRDDGVVPVWVDEHDARRLLAYRALDAYLDNVHRYWLPAQMWQADPVTDSAGMLRDGARPAAEGFREYGHAALLVNTARSLLLGHEQTVAAADPAAIAAAQTGEQEGRADATVAAQIVEWTAAWAAREGLESKVYEAETATIGLGDSVFTLGWDARTRRPRLRVYDPGLYFPDWAALDDPAYNEWEDEDFPPVVHLAWEVTRDDVTYLRRTTWRMVKTGELRSMPWGGIATPWRCVQRIEEWRTDRLDGRSIYALGYGSGRVVRDDVDLGIDFIPVVHVPNEHTKHKWGRSVLLLVTQLLDDLAGAQTDLNVDSSLVASPPTVVSGAGSGGSAPLETGPGSQWNVGDGNAQMLDTSRALDALLKYVDRLEDTLSTQARVAAVLLGKVDPADAASGYAMRLGLAPTEALISEMARVRAGKYPLLLRFAARLAQSAGVAGGGLPAGPTPPMVLHLGTGMPTARQAAIEEVTALFKERLISTETAVAMLREAGLPIAEVAAEVARLRAEDFEGARLLVEAVGDVPAARARLQLAGVDVPPAAASALERLRAAAAPASGTDPASPSNVPALTPDPGVAPPAQGRTTGTL